MPTGRPFGALRPRDPEVTGVCRLTVAVALLVLVAGCGGSGGGTPTAQPGDDATPVAPTAATPNGSATPPGSTTGTAPTGSGPKASTDPGPTPTSTATTATTPVEANASDYAIPVRGNGSIPFDVNRTFARTVRSLGTKAGPPPQVSLYWSPNPYRPTVTEPFASILLDARESSNLTVPRATGVVMESVGKSSLELRYTLAHEFTHYVQFQRTEGTAVRHGVFYADDHQTRRIAASIMEGSASYTALEVVNRYTEFDRGRVLSAVDEYRNASPAGKYAWAPYHFGRRYVDQRVDSPADHWFLYENPPNTTEELIHGLAPGSEPPATLSTDVTAGEWSVAERETRGELFLRVVLAAELPESRAAEGAAGWGNDELLTLETDDGPGYAWAIRWDTPEDATQFREAFGAAMDARANRSGEIWTANGTAIDLQRVAPETVVVFAGERSFVTEADADGENGTVTVGVAE